ncbi:MAG: hypothetical protein ACHQFZ_03840 [Acidimicrobiales bacterium]
MKFPTIRSLAAIGLVAALGIGVPAAAFGDSTTTTNLSAKETNAWTTWKAAWVTYIKGLEAINATYRASVKAAHSTYVTARRAAKTKAERQAALTAFDVSLAAALNVRVAAITAAGNPPAPPASYNGTAYVLGLQAADIAHRAAVTAAESAYASALASATTPDQRRIARLTLIAAVDTADAARANALIALGSPPKHPGQPSS